jgi:hypothetical protein
VVAALDTTRQAMRSVPETSHPFYWAGFVIVGDGETEISLTRRRSFPWYAVLAALLVVAGIAVMMHGRQVRHRRS